MEALDSIRVLNPLRKFSAGPDVILSVFFFKYSVFDNFLRMINNARLKLTKFTENVNFFF